MSVPGILSVIDATPLSLEHHIQTVNIFFVFLLFKNNFTYLVPINKNIYPFSHLFKGHYCFY